MRVLKKVKPRRSFVLRVAVLAFAAYVILALVNQQVQISQKARELGALQNSVRAQELKNDDIRHALTSGQDRDADYIERVAREEFGYVKSGERVFINIQGN